MSDKPTAVLQENLITLLCFSPEHASLIRNSVDIHLFEGEYRDIAEKAYFYFDQYGSPPDEHIADLFEEILQGEDSKKAEVLNRLLKDLWASRKTIHPEYVMDRLDAFIRMQRMKEGIIGAAQKIQSGGDLAIEEAEEILSASIQRGLQLFDPGIFFSDSERALSFLDKQMDSFPTGIPELDRRSLGPGRKELHLFVAPMKRGKTWWLVNLGKRAWWQDRKKVLHVTLEMSEERMIGRYIQCLFGIPKRDEKTVISKFELEEVEDEKGRKLWNHLVGVTEKQVKHKIALSDPKIKEYLRKKITQHGVSMDRILIKQFPTGFLTINGLIAYLDSLEMTRKFVPDLLIIDYPDLMKIDSGVHRIDLGRIYKELRGIAVERNIAVACASQANRAGMSATTVRDEHVAEDISKIATADCVLTYSQTDSEKEQGLARIYVANGRNDEDRFTLLISQNYSTGQFVLESTPMVSNYWQMLGDPKPEE